MRYLMFLLENVPGIQGPNLRVATHLLQLAGYVVEHTFLSSLQFFLPQSRTRVWIMGYSRERALQAGLTEERIKPMLLSYTELLKSSEDKCLALDDIWLHETHPAVQRSPEMPGPAGGGPGFGLGQRPGTGPGQGVGPGSGCSTSCLAAPFPTKT